MGMTIKGKGLYRLANTPLADGADADKTGSMYASPTKTPALFDLDQMRHDAEVIYQHFASGGKSSELGGITFIKPKIVSDSGNC
jgi:hypothetical protein